MTPREEIAMWFREQVTIHGEPATEDDYGRFGRPKSPGVSRVGFHPRDNGCELSESFSEGTLKEA
jgi:hypothetical protein